MNNTPRQIVSFEAISMSAKLINENAFVFKSLVHDYLATVFEKLGSIEGFPESPMILLNRADALRKTARKIYKWSTYAEELGRDFLTSHERMQALELVNEGGKSLRSMDWNFAHLSEPGQILHGAPTAFETLSIIGSALSTMDHEIRQIKTM